MKAVKITIVILSAALLAIGIGTTASAFHSGGVAECGGCHSMHSPAAGGSFLLVGTDQSSACLTCHEGPTLSSYHVSTSPASLGAGAAPVNLTPGGDFGWLKKTYSFTVRGNTTTEQGSTHGHNIIAADFGYVVDDNNATAPGGSFPSAQLACNSCHDPHGKYRRLFSGAVSRTGAPIKGSGSYDNVTTNEPDANNAVGVYRLLAGAGYTKDGVTFAGVPPAKVPGSYNRTEAVNQTRVAYGVANGNGNITWGNWCATCHPDMHSTGNYVHPVDQGISSGTISNYNQYVKTGDMTGTSTTSFTSLVPFATNSGGTNAGYVALAALAKNNDSQLGGPASGDQVTCMSCHRAHASGWEYALRWNMEGEFMTYDSQYPGTDVGSPVQFSRGRTQAETQAAYYNRPVTKFATYQRVLCNKCHAQD